MTFAHRPQWRGRGRPVLAMALALAVGLGVASCGSTAPAPTPAGSTAQQQAAAGQANRVRALNGAQLTVPVPGRVTVAYFFAPGCATCIPATKQLAQAQRQVGKAQFVALNLIPDIPTDALRSFLHSAGNPQVPVVKNGVPLAQARQVTALGTTIVYGPDGQQVFRGVDASASAIINAVRKARP